MNEAANRRLILYSRRSSLGLQQAIAVGEGKMVKAVGTAKPSRGEKSSPTRKHEPTHTVRRQYRDFVDSDEGQRALALNSHSETCNSSAATHSNEPRTNRCNSPQLPSHRRKHLLDTQNDKGDRSRSLTLPRTLASSRTTSNPTVQLGKQHHGDQTRS